MAQRDGPLGDIKPPVGWMAVVVLAVAAIVAMALFLGDRRESTRSGVFAAARRTSDAVVEPIAAVLAAPMRWLSQGAGAARDYGLAGAQNAGLRRDLAAARRWKDEALALREENARYRALLGVKTDPPIPMVFARAIGDARGPFSNTRLASAGSARGVIEGNPVLSEHGLVGRVTGVGATVSRIMLLTDVESRTPVLIVRTNGRAILTGDGGPNPRLAYLRTQGSPRDGDRVLTSGDGGVIPRGLPVGVAVKGYDGAWRVALDSDEAPIDYVQILLFKDFSQLTAPQSLAPRELPSVKTEAPAAAAAADKPVTPPQGGPRATAVQPSPAHP